MHPDLPDLRVLRGTLLVLGVTFIVGLYPLTRYCLLSTLPGRN
jgi:hypothetical protein